MRRALGSLCIGLGLFMGGCGDSRPGVRPGTGSGGSGGGSAGTGTSAAGGTTLAQGGTTTNGGVGPSTAGAGPDGTAGGVSVGGQLSVGGASGAGRGAGGSAGSSVAAGGTGGGTGATGGTGNGGRAASAGAGGSGIVSPDVTVHLDQPQQTMDGFGINHVFSPELTDAQADQLFDPTHGIGLSILRIAMGTDGNPFDSATWSSVMAAKARGVTTFIATAWSAPANCKSNANVNDGGHLNADCYDSWATALAKFPSLVKQNTGVDLYGISPQQEPDFASCGTASPCNGDFPSMLWTSSELISFVKILSPKLRALDPPVRLLGPDTAEWLHLWSNQSAAGSTDPLKGSGYDYGHALFADPDAWPLMDLLATQQYDDAKAAVWPSDVPRTKSLWMTEMSGNKFGPEQGPSNDIQNGVAVAGWIHDAIVNGPASAWLYFWRAALNTDDNEGLILKDGRETKRLYTFGNFSKFIRPGYTRMTVTGDVPDNVLLTAYAGPDGTVVIVAINRGASDVSVPIFISGGQAPASLVPYFTSATDNLAVKTSVAFGASSFTAALGATSVTTFVGALN
jgi:O-glycosyl hydrolase